MQSFDDILAEATTRTGGAAALRERLPKPRSQRELRHTADAHYLSLMSRRIFRAGLKHSMVDGKWPAFEEVFFAFEPEAVAMMSDEALEALLSDKRIIRHWGKIKSVRSNAQAMRELRHEHGSMGHFLADWPGHDALGLWDELKTRFTQLGGNSAAYFLRMAGKDTFLLTPYVVRALRRWDVLSGEGLNRGDRRRAQTAMVAWAETSGRPLCEVSMILAMSVD